MSAKSSPIDLPGRGQRSDEIEVGRIVGVFGVQGEVRVHLHNRESTLVDDARDVVLVGPDGRRRGVQLALRPGAGKRIIGRIGGVDAREQAAAWADWVIVVPREALPELDEDEFYVADVVGLPVHVDGEVVGEVVGVHATGGGDLLEIRVGKEAHFVPLRREVVQLDLDGGRVVVAADALEEP